ncbi:MAG: FHA domain-containing protein [Sedimentisphaerales bacterium]|nr:FHA domain-containing protein [Sedimentisphaerales bacterium]
MRLIVKQRDGSVREFQFDTGPIYIGRHPNSQILLSDRSISRQHAVIFTTHDGKWMLEDLDSANKTFLNDKEIHKSSINSGDMVRISNYTIEVGLESEDLTDKPVQLEDTLITPPRQLHSVIRKIEAEHGQDIHIPAKRTKEFLQACETICHAAGPDEVLQALLSIIVRQFSAFHVWCALRSQSSGPMTSHAGRGKSGSSFELSQIKINEQITEAVEKERFLLLPNLPEEMKEAKICSAMIAPIMNQSGCFGVIYIDNATDHEHYSLSDLDYLMLIAIHTGVVLKNF